MEAEKKSQEGETTVEAEVNQEVETRVKEIKRILLNGDKTNFHDRKNFGFLRKLLPKVLAEVEPMTGVSSRKKTKGTTFFDPIAKKPVRPGLSVWTVQGYDLGLDNTSSEALVAACDDPAIKKLVKPNEINETKFNGGGNFSKQSKGALEGLKARLEEDRNKPKQKPNQYKGNKPRFDKNRSKPRADKPKAKVIVPKAALEEE
jgi:hypothetical protein